MNLPSVGVVVTAALRTARRFPLVLGAAFVATAVAFAMVGKSGESTELLRLLLTAILAIPLLLALSLFGERWAASSQWIFPAFGLVVVAGFWAAWPGWYGPVQALRYVQLAICFHLLVAYLPHALINEPNGFWQYNRELFERFLVASLFSAVLFAGLALAMLALDRLFSVTVGPHGYQRLFILIAFVFHPWFFLGGIGEALAALEGHREYPNGLRVFTQYVLVPIVALYLVILTLYLGKVVITRQWPSGWIGWLVSGVAATGIFSWLLVRPLEEREGFAWVRPFTKGFYLVLMPSVVMLLMAIGKRVGQYGVTEPRYFLTVLSVWLAAIALYFTLSRSRSIKVIPASLCAVCLVTFAGPLSAYRVSEASQLARVREVLVRNDLLAGGRLRPATREASLADRMLLSAGFRWLLQNEGVEPIAPWLPDSLRAAVDALHKPSLMGSGEGGAQMIVAYLKLEYVAVGQPSMGGRFMYWVPSTRDAVAIDGYSYSVRLSNWTPGDTARVTDRVTVQMSADSATLVLWRDGAAVLDIPLTPLLDSAAAFRRRNPGKPLPNEVMQAAVHAGDVAAKVLLWQASGVRRGAEARMTVFDGQLYVKLP